jgi:hypothetical protein
MYLAQRLVKVHDDTLHKSIMSTLESISKTRVFKMTDPDDPMKSPFAVRCCIA